MVSVLELEGRIRFGSGAVVIAVSEGRGSFLPLRTGRGPAAEEAHGPLHASAVTSRRRTVKDPVQFLRFGAWQFVYFLIGM
jgi:hypothetical protein